MCSPLGSLAAIVAMARTSGTELISSAGKWANAMSGPRSSTNTIRGRFKPGRLTVNRSADLAPAQEVGALSGSTLGPTPARIVAGSSLVTSSAVVMAAKTSPTLASWTVSPAARISDVSASRACAITSGSTSLHTNATTRTVRDSANPSRRAQRARSTSETCSLSRSSTAPGSAAYEDEPNIRSRMMAAAAAMRSATMASSGPGPPLRSSHTCAPLPSSTFTRVLVGGTEGCCALRPSDATEMKTPRRGS